MNIISLSPKGIKASESYNDTSIDDTATELLGLREFVVESYDVDDTKQESRFYCGIQFDYAINNMSPLQKCKPGYSRSQASWCPGYVML